MRQRFARPGLLLALLAAPLVVDGQVVINEVLASNRLTSFDDDRDSSDWVELFNSGANEASLAGFALSDDPREPRKWLFPDVSIPPGGYLLVWCSGKDRTILRPETITAANSQIPFEPRLVTLEAVWKYLTGAPTDPGPAPDWKLEGLDDAAWISGIPGFGFGDDDDATILPPGIGAVFLRHEFTATHIETIRNLVFQVKYDDGFVLYLNGVRAAAANFSPDAEPTFASVATRTEEARTTRRFDLTPFLGALREGKNLIAIALLNQSPQSEDLSLIPELGTMSAPLHTSFSLDADGEHVVLTRPDGGVEDSVALPRQIDDQSYGRSPSGTGEFRYLLTPTPLAANDVPSSSEPLVVADTKFSVGRGFFTGPFQLEIATATPGAEIRYTLDGTPPTATEGIVYAGAIAISKTTAVRAAGFKPGLKPTNVDTHTYVFLDDVIRQSFQSTVDAGFPPTWGSVPADYGMDPDVIGQEGTDKYGGKYAATIKDDLVTIPTISIVMPVDDLFGPRGIYANSESRGVQWERAASAELIFPDGTEGFHINAGLRVQGGAFRSHGLTKKHSLRLVFKSVYGPSKLKFPLFEYHDATDSFDTLTLRANSNDGWQWDAAGGKPLYIRDSFGRETVLDMGGVSSHEKFVHVYLNGAYWGLYDVVERPDASFSATYFGGKKGDWDAMSNDVPNSGTAAAWSEMLAQAKKGLGPAEAYGRIQGNNADGTDNPDLESYLDVPNLIDYMIVNLYVGNTDWPHKNWWTGRSRVQSTGFKFYMWDSEWSMGIQSDLGTNQTSVANGVSVPYGACRANAEFRITFADHLQKCLSPGGALYVDPSNPAWDPAHPERNAPAARFDRLARTVDRAIVAESARWGDQHAAKPYTHDEHWQVERQNLLKAYLPQRSGLVLNQFRAVKLYPATAAPIFSQHGGSIPSGFRLIVRAPAGDVYYTLDGSDPRLLGGAISPLALHQPPFPETALVSTGGAARVLVPKDGALGLEWTAPDFDDSAWLPATTGIGFEGATGYESLIATDLKDSMLNVSASVYIRIPFDADLDLESLFLSLRMQYDDGFAAYLNGSLIASQNAPDGLAWDSAATRSHSDAQAVLFEATDVSSSARLLRRGRNVLAVHGLNVRAADNDFLIVPELSATSAKGREITLDATTKVRARALVDADWSALSEAVFVVDESMPLRITEVMYHPAEPTDGGPWTGEDFEFIEVENVGSSAFDLTGARLTGGVELRFASGDVHSLPPGAFAVLVKNLEAFQSRYDTSGMLIAGEYDGKLSNGGDSLVIEGSFGEKLIDFAYDDGWYPETDGDGRSLVIADASLPPGTLDRKTSWRPSARAGGSPGAADDATGSSGGLQLQGDANQDGRRNISDAVRLLLRLFGGLAAPLPCDGGALDQGGNRALHDLNGDGAVNLTDAAYLVSYLFQRGPPPSMGPTCVPIPGCPDACAE